MYLSAFTLDEHSYHVQKCLANAHEMHRTLLSCFSKADSETPRREFGVLYREQIMGRKIRLYVVSKIFPNWQTLQRQGFIQLGQPKNMIDICQQITMGGCYSFDILACTSKKTSTPTEKSAKQPSNSRRIFLNSQEDRDAWLKRKAIQHGFRLCWYREEGQVRSIISKSHRELAYNQAVHFRGELEVTDKECFSEAFLTGIGAGKAYGLGMLLLYPQGAWSGA